MRAIAEGLFTDEMPQRLIGGRDRESGRVVFPRPEGDRYETVPLARDGVLWSFTVQRFRPKTPPYAGPESFAPWIVAYVELLGEIIVEARLVNVSIADVAIGMPVRLTQVALDPDAPERVAIPAFEPVGATA